jgi:hypothetical protein
VILQVAGGGRVPVPAREEVLVDPRICGHWRLIRSPASKVRYQPNQRSTVASPGARASSDDSG